MIISEENINNLDIEALSVVPTKNLVRRLGKNEDYVELAIYDLNGNLLTLDEDFRGYTIGDDVDKNGLYNDIKLDYEEVLRSYNYVNGKYNIVLNFYRKAILNSPIKPFYISEISPSRRELKIKSDLLPNNQVISSFEQLIGVIDLSGYFREYILNFGDANTATAINFAIDIISDPTEILIKLFEPLPNNISTNSKFYLAEEIINPISVVVDMGTFNIQNAITGEELRGPNFRIDTRLNSSKSSIFRTYDDILGSSVSSSFSNINNYISGNLELAIDFSDVDTDTGYHFENFIHFGSALEKLKNFKYKLQLLESYDEEIGEIDTLEGDQTSSIFVKTERKDIERKKQNLLGNFDAYERFLYYESGTYSWPKSNSSRPYTNIHTTSSNALTWLGSEDYNNVYYGGQLLSGSEYDGINIHKLTNTIPGHILSNPNNAQYELFVNMVAEHFDKIWIYIDHITNINQAENKLNRGVSKDLVYNVLENAGINVFDQFENENLFSYIIGDYAADGTFQYQAPISQSMISASNAGSIPKGDITKEIWKRINHNLPYLLKTKGTERGLKALISCYGIPESILHVKEYGGPVTDKTTFRTFTYQKSSKLSHYESGNNIARTPLISGIDSKTIQVRHLPSGSQPHDIFTIKRTGTGNPFISVAISQSVNPNLENSSSFAFLTLASGSAGSPGTIKTIATSSEGPLYNGETWNFSVVLDGENELITAYATNTTQNKNTFVLSCSINPEEQYFDINEDRTIQFGPNYQFLFAPISGGIQEARVFNEYLTKKTIVSQSLSPFNYNGNNISSSFDNLLIRYPLGSNDVTPIAKNYAPNSPYSAPTLGTITTKELLETHHLTTPDTVGKAMVSDKVRLDQGVIEDDILSPFVRSETSVYDRQPVDFSDLGVFFSPTFEVNEDIIYTLGGFRLDDYIGDPRHYTSGSYPDLEDLKEIYTQKITGRLTNTWDYLKLIQQFDHTLFKMIEQFVPAKANLKTGLVIEPHYLERPKLAGTHLTTDTSYNEFDLNIPDPGPTITSEYDLHEANYNIYDVVTEGSRGTVENNVIYGEFSKKFYTRIAPYAQSITTDSNVVTDNDGGPIAPPER